MQPGPEQSDGVRVLTRDSAGHGDHRDGRGLRCAIGTRSVKRWVLAIGRASRSKTEQGKAKLKTLYQTLLMTTRRVVGQVKRFVADMTAGVKCSADLMPASGGRQLEGRARGDAAARRLGTEFGKLLVKVHGSIGRVPDLAAADPGFYSTTGEATAKAMGVKRVSVPATGTKSARRSRNRRFKKTQRWRTGCEGRISVLKRRHGLNRCRYRGR